MGAVEQYKNLTGINIAGRDFTRFTDIIGDGQGGKDFDPELFISFLYCVLADGCYPNEPDFTRKDVAHWIRLYDRTIAGKMLTLYMEDMTGKAQDELLKQIDEGKNLEAPQAGATSGPTSSTSPTESSG